MRKSKLAHRSTFITPKLSLIFLFTVINSFPANASNDSLRQVWTNPSASDSNRFAAINAYYIRNSFALPDSVLALGRLHVDLARQKDSQQEMVKALNNRGLGLYVLGRNEEAMDALKQALDIVIELDDSVNMARQYVNIGSIYRNQNNYAEAVKYYTLGLSILTDKSMQADVLNNLGLVYEDIKQYDLAKHYLTQALTRYQEVGLAEKIGNIWLNMGAVEFAIGDHQSAIEYGQKAIPILKAENNRISVANTYRLFAQVYQEIGTMDSALQYISKSLDIHQDMKNEGAIADNRILLAELVFVRDVDEAARMGEDILPKLEKMSGTRPKRDLYNLLYRCYKDQQKYRQSLEMHEAFNTYADSVLREENNIALIREAVQREYDVKLLQTQLDNEQAQARLHLQQVKERYSIILVAVILIGLILFYARSRALAHQKQKDALLAEIEELKRADASAVALQPNGFQLDKVKMEQSIDRRLNETDWTVLNLLLDDPVISNKEIAQRAFMSIDGIGSSLRRMYSAFEVKESKYKKISLLMKAIKLSNG